MEIGHVIKQLRERNGWSQEELAHRVGMSTANLSRIESGRHGVGPELTGLLAKELGMRVFELYALAEGVVPERFSGQLGVTLGKDEEALISAYRRMSRDCQQTLRATAEFFVGSR